MGSKFFHSLDVIVAVNFIISVIYLITGTLLSLSDRYSFFELNQDLYGEFVSNFKVTLLYLAITELIICAYCFFSKKNECFILVGFFLVLMIGSIYFYSKINNIELDDNLSLFFLYTGVSHIIFGIMSDVKKNRVRSTHSSH
ncbi:MAG: hypothetical protein QX189_12945 [Methylococcales bacterium]